MTETTIYGFTGIGTDAANSEAGLTRDANGGLFGTSLYGGSDGDGTVFKIKAGATTATTLYNFTGTGADGANPLAGLILDANGDLFGTTYLGGSDSEGTVFEIKAGATTATTLYSFTGIGTDGAGPTAGLILDSTGNLFGTTYLGGSNSKGAVFEIKAGATTATTLYSFTGTGADGANPQAGLILDANGDLFGTTSGGGLGGDGTVFEIKAGATTATTLYSFTGTHTDGANPDAGLILDANGNLFGTTYSGGSNGQGTVFEIKAGAATATTLYSFTGTGTDGANPQAGLILDANSDLFGTTSSGGSNGEGSVFEIKSGATTATTLYSFTGTGTDGANPVAGLNTDANGDLFGTTSGGGSDGDGTVFEITDSGFVMCFLPGVQIATPAGEVPVECLAVNDAVLTLRGQIRRITWIGHGRVLAARGRRNAATPIIIRKSALADNVPNRDLHITKAHSLYIDDVLIPVEFLVNHRSILWDDHAQEVSVYHVELETHDVLLANGVPVESYRDDGNRWLFQNANSGWDLPPQEPCAPVRTGGPVVDAAWRRFLDRFGPSSALPLTDDPDLHLLVDGRRLDAAERAGEAYVFLLPAEPDSLRIVTRAAVPQELGSARDPRSLGVALRRIIVRQGTKSRETEATDALLTEGFYSFEPENGFRWTDGDAALPVDLCAEFSGPVEIVLMVASTTRYIDEGFQQQVA